MTGEGDIGRYLAGDLSAEVTLARLLLAGVSPEQIADLPALDGTPRGRALRHMIAGRRKDLRELQAIFAGLDHGARSSSPAETVRRIRQAFDRAVAASPEASVAAYSLGDPAILAAATQEIVVWLDATGLIRPASDVLDLGCGIGRVATALAPRVRSVLGLDVSPAMTQEAGLRCAAPNVKFIACSGIDLSEVPSRAYDLLLAVDSFPYLMQAGSMLAERHVADAARVLRAGGALAILNLSYRGDPRADALDAARWAVTHGFTAIVLGDVPFKLWDGRAFVLRRPGP